MKLLFTILFLGLAFNSFASKEGPKKKKSVYVLKAKKEEIFDSYVYPAKVEPKVNAVVLSESQGIVSRIHKTLGQKVYRRHTVISIKHTDPVYKYRPMSLKAPVRGVVSKVFVSEGSLVSKGQKLLMITDPTRAKVIIEVTAKDMAYIKNNQKGFLQLKGREKRLPVIVKGISPFVDPATGTATAELELLNRGRLPLGALGQVTFKANRHFGFVVPERALYYQGKKTFLRLVKKGISNQVEVKVGAKRRGQVEILSGLKQNQIFIERASGFIPEGAEVEVKSLKKPKKTTKKKNAKGKA